MEISIKALSEDYEQSLKELGFANEQDFRTYWIDLHVKRVNFASDEQFSEFVGKGWEKRLEEARARRKLASAPPKPALASRLPSILNDEMAVPCRIIVRNISSNGIIFLILYCLSIMRRKIGLLPVSNTVKIPLAKIRSIRK